MNPSKGSPLVKIEERVGFRSHLLRQSASRIRCYVWRECMMREKDAVVLIPARLARTIGCSVKTARAGIRELEEIGYIRILRGGGSTGRARLVTLGWKNVDELRMVAARLQQLRWTAPPSGKRVERGNPASTDPGNPVESPLGSLLGRVERSCGDDNCQPLPELPSTPSGPSENLLIRTSAHQEFTAYTAPLRSHRGGLSVFFSEQPDHISKRDRRKFLDLAEALALEEGFVQEMANTFPLEYLLPLLGRVHERCLHPSGDLTKDVENAGGLIRKTLQYWATFNASELLQGERSAADKYSFEYRSFIGT